MARRGQGEGTIIQRKDGRWAAAVDLGWSSGKRTRKWLYGTSRAEVAAKLTKTLRDLQQGIAPSDERVTLTACITDYLNDMEARKSAAHATLVRYRGILKNYIEPTFGHQRIAQLQPRHVREYQTELLRHGLSTSTIILHRALLSGALNQAVADGLIPRNVVPIVKPPKDESEPKGKSMEPEHARALLAASAGDALAVFYLLLLTAGLRTGEALGLRWRHIELARSDGPSLLRVQEQLQWQNGAPATVPLKSRRSKRTIPVPVVTTRALCARRELQQALFAAQGRTWQISDLVHTTPQGDEVHKNTIIKQFHANLRAAGVPHYRPHDLRHTYGSLLMSQGVPLKTISDLMGHASIEVTANVYLHSLEGQVLDTADAIARALEGPAELGPATVCPTCGSRVQDRWLSVRLSNQVESAPDDPVPISKSRVEPISVRKGGFD